MPHQFIRPRPNQPVPLLERNNPTPIPPQMHPRPNRKPQPTNRHHIPQRLHSRILIKPPDEQRVMPIVKQQKRPRHEWNHMPQPPSQIFHRSIFMNEEPRDGPIQIPDHPAFEIERPRLKKVHTPTLSHDKSPRKDLSKHQMKPPKPTDP